MQKELLALGTAALIGVSADSPVEAQTKPQSSTMITVPITTDMCTKINKTVEICTVKKPLDSQGDTKSPSSNFATVKVATSMDEALADPKNIITLQADCNDPKLDQLHQLTQLRILQLIDCNGTTIQLPPSIKALPLETIWVTALTTTPSPAVKKSITLPKSTFESSALTDIRVISETL